MLLSLFYCSCHSVISLVLVLVVLLLVLVLLVLIVVEYVNFSLAMLLVETALLAAASDDCWFSRWCFCCFCCH